MSLTELFILAVGLSMDAFAVAVCKGLSMQKMDVNYFCKVINDLLCELLSTNKVWVIKSPFRILKLIF